MTFQEIFNEDGLYETNSFSKGVCFEIKQGNLYLVQYKNPSDILPSKEFASVYKELFNKDYKKVFTRQELFK